MLSRVFLSTLCVALAVNPAFAKEKVKSAETGEQVACAGVYGPDSSEALLIETFGAENVLTGMVYGAEGMELLATTVFPEDPDRKMQFGWFDEDTLSGLSYVDLSPSQVGPLGLKLGQTPAEVAAINGQAFNIGGFWWDYGGYAHLEEGAIRDVTDCWIGLRFSPSEDYPEDLDITPVAGEVEVPIDEPLLTTLDVRLSELSLSYEAPEGDE